MELTNSTPLPAKVVVAAPPGQPGRIGILVAKATYKFDLQGRVEIDTQTPFPLFDQDQDTSLGALPNDTGARRGPRFEVMLLGNAHPSRPPATVTKVALSVGSERRELMVFGDRTWLVGPPQPSRHW